VLVVFVVSMVLVVFVISMVFVLSMVFTMFEPAAGSMFE
jgi:hypothetical protein